MSLFLLCNSTYVREASSFSFLNFVNFQLKYKQYLKCQGPKHYSSMQSRHSGCITSSNYTEQWKQPFLSPELLLLYIHYHSAHGHGEQYDSIKTIISRLYIQPYLNYICRSIKLRENKLSEKWRGIKSSNAFWNGRKKLFGILCRTDFDLCRISDSLIT